MESRKELILSLEGFDAGPVQEIGGSSMKANLYRALKKKGERICQGACDLVNRFLENAVFEHLRKANSEPLHATFNRLVELALLVEGFKLNPDRQC